MTVPFKVRRQLETKIAMATVRLALEAGYLVSVYDGSDVALEKSTDARAILKALFTTDEDWLQFYRPDGANAGWVRLVYGNSGWDVINDFTANLPFMPDVELIADGLEEMWDR